VRLTYRYCLYPSRAQIVALEAQLEFCCDLYNAGLQERRDAWKKGVRVGRYDQERQLTEVRRESMAPAMNSWTQIDALMRLDRAFVAFFRRCRSGEKAGYPRFRSKRRYDSLTWSFSGNAGGVALAGDKLRLQGVGGVKVKWHRKIPQDVGLKTVTVTRSCGRWYACFSMEVEVLASLTNESLAVGVDLGIASFAALSTGELIDGPRPYRAARAELRVAQRRVARRKKGGNRRRKAVAQLRRQHERVRNARRDHAHKLSRRLVREFGLIAVEGLNIEGLAAGILAKDVSDQGWGEFLAMLGYKAEGAGSRIVVVDPRQTSQLCSGCGGLVPKDLRCRVHRCPECGLVLDRDVNAARVILARGLGSSLQAPTVEGVPRAVA
jgi:putative transposase